MDSSGNTIQPGSGPAEKPAASTVFAGTVTGIKKEGGAQTLEIQYSQGKVRFQAEGDFQLGERVKLSFPGNGSVQVEKGPLPNAAGDWQGVGYTLPRNMTALKDLRAFEENLVKWMAAKQPGSAPLTAQEKESLSRLSLPQLLMKAMDKAGGKDFLGQTLPSLHRGVVSALMDALNETKGDAGVKSALLDLLKSLGRSPDGAAADAVRGKGGRQGAAGPFMQAEAGAGHAPWFGRIVEKQQADGFLSPMQRLQFTGTGGPPKSDPLYRYQIDMGGRTMEVFSSQSKEAGEFADFELERQGGRVQARFTDPAASLPASLKTLLAGATGEARQGLLLASHYLQDFKDEPYYEKLVKDFGEVLAQSGRLDARPAGGPGIPDQKEMDGLLKLFVAFPRDTEHPERQAKVWGNAVNDPQAMMHLLKTLRPEQDSSLLRSDTALRMAAEGRIPADVEALLSEAAEKGESPEQTAAWLKRLLPEAFKSEDLMKLAKDASPLTPAGREHEAAKFLLQAVAHSFPQDAQIQEGKPSQFYFYQGQEWRNLQVTWERGNGKEGKGKSGPQGPLQVKVQTTAKNMGQVNVGISWEPKGAKLDFRNQFHDVRELLSQSLPELEKSLALMDFRVTAWSYELLPDKSPDLPDPGWTRPASLSDGANLDITG
jgi:hypothetical protein